MAHAVYSPKEVSIAYDGVGIITGFADETFLEMERNSELTDQTIGADGTLATTRIADRSGTVKITLMQTAESNLLLSALVTAQENSPVLFTGAFQIIDASGSVLASATGAYISAVPTVTLGAGQNTKEWMFIAETLIYSAIPNNISQEINAKITAIESFF